MSTAGLRPGKDWREDKRAVDGDGGGDLFFQAA